MKYYNPNCNIIAYEEELLNKGIDISNTTVMSSLGWYNLCEYDLFIYDSSLCKIVRSGSPIYNHSTGMYEQFYKVVSLSPIEQKDKLEDTKTKVYSLIDEYTTNKLAEGFDTYMDVEGVSTLLHFSYDQTDQNNFSDAANLSIISLNIDIGITTVEWNGYREYNKSTGGKLVVLTLNAMQFLQLYTVALNHKSKYLIQNEEMKQIVDNTVSVEDLKIAMSKYGMEINHVL